LLGWQSRHFGFGTTKTEVAASSFCFAAALHCLVSYFGFDRYRLTFRPAEKLAYGATRRRKPIAQ
jgi:hypothetical protein